MSRSQLVNRLLLSFAIAAFQTAPADARASSTLIVHARHAVQKKTVAPISGREGVAITLSAPRGPTGTRYEWDLNNDGTFETKGRSVSAIFSDNGTYDARYRLIEPLRKTRAAIKFRNKIVRGKRRIAIQNSVPVANAGGPYHGTAGVTVRFSGGGSDKGTEDRQAGLVYLWDFGDGSTAQGRNLVNPQHTYDNEGAYTVSLTTRDKDGGNSSPDWAYVTVQAADHGSPTPTATPRSTPPPSSGPLTTVRPQEIDDLFSNPGMGWQSADRINSSGHDGQGLPNSVAYIKYYWKDLEPGNSTFNWATLDQHLAQAHASGQKVALRIVVVDNITSGPAWLRTAGAAGTWISYTGDGGSPPSVWSPSLTDSTFQQKHFEFLRALGRRYDGHPDLDSVDIGSVGLWGEWHFWGVTPQVAMPNAATLQLIIDKYVEAFPTTPLVAQLENQTGLTYAISRGAGYRGDCLGYVDNQMPYLYEPNIQAAHAQDAWRHAPIQFEACWSIASWVSRGYSLRYIFDWALARHVTGLNNKNATVPSAAMPELQRFLKKMGYRFVLREMRAPESAHAGDAIVLSSDWENIGVAPTYTDYRLAYQLRNVSGQVVATLVTGETSKNWIPGTFQVDDTFVLPSGLAHGTYTLAVGIVDPSTGTVPVRLAIAGRDGNGWYPLNTLRIE